MIQIDYEKMKTPDLKKQIESRDIKCRMVREDMIKMLKLHDADLYIYETIKEKNKNGTFMVGIDIKNTEELIEMGKKVDRKEATSLKMYFAKRVWFELK